MSRCCYVIRAKIVLKRSSGSEPRDGQRVRGRLVRRRGKRRRSVSHIQGISEAIRRVLGQLGIRTAMRSSKIKWWIMKGVKDKQKEGGDTWSSILL